MLQCTVPSLCLQTSKWQWWGHIQHTPLPSWPWRANSPMPGWTPSSLRDSCRGLGIILMCMSQHRFYVSFCSTFAVFLGGHIQSIQFCSNVVYSMTMPFSVISKNFLWVEFHTNFTAQNTLKSRSYKGTFCMSLAECSIYENPWNT